MRWERGSHSSGVKRDVHDDQHRNEEEKHNDTESEEFADDVISSCEVAILPDNVCGLRRVLEAEFLSKELLLRVVFHGEDLRIV